MEGQSGSGDTDLRPRYTYLNSLILQSISALLVHVTTTENRALTRSLYNKTNKKQKPSMRLRLRILLVAQYVPDKPPAKSLS